MKIDLTSAKLNLSREIRALRAFAGVLSAGLIFFLNAAPVSAGFPLHITVSELRALAPNSVIVLDTRSTWSFLLGHIPQAQPTGSWKDYTLTRDGVPGQLNRDTVFLAGKLRGLGVERGKTLVIYGDPQNKWREDGRFFWMLEYLGFEKVALLHGGFEAWQEADFPIERGSALPAARSGLKPEDLRFNENVGADQTWIRQRLGTPDLVLVDNRERSEYDGATPYGSARGGHIPGAVHIDWRDFFDPAGLLKPPAQLTSLLAGYGIRPGKEVVVYCTGGVRSGMGYFVFRTLGYSVRNYDGSWWDWSHNPSLPVEPS